MAGLKKLADGLEREPSVKNRSSTGPKSSSQCPQGYMSNTNWTWWFKKGRRDTKLDSVLVTFLLLGQNTKAT